MTKHKFNIGQSAWYRGSEWEQVTIIQKRIENGHFCYRVVGESFEGIVHENLLSL